MIFSNDHVFKANLTDIQFFTSPLSLHLRIAGTTVRDDFNINLVHKQ